MTAPDAPLPAPTPDEDTLDLAYFHGYRAGIESAARYIDAEADEFHEDRESRAARSLRNIARAIRALSPDAADHGDDR